jgi:hypothetical protein
VYRQLGSGLPAVDVLDREGSPEFIPFIPTLSMPGAPF